MKKEQLREVARKIHEKLSIKKQPNITYLHNKVIKASLNIHENNEIRNKAMKHDLSLASAKIEQKIVLSIGKILDIVNDYQKRLNEERKPIDEQYCLDELIACNNTYKSLVYEDGYLKITTNKIVLQNVDLGRFEVWVSLEDISQSPNSFIRINALEPNYAAGGSSYPHPHVDHSSLCMGEGYSLICDAAQQGRIEDVFNLAVNILSNYNEDSPYHDIEQWDGILCQRCEESYDPDNSGTYCDHCDRSICDSCSSYCDCCERSVCSIHMETTCDICDTSACSNCAQDSRCCARCDTTMCENCTQSCQICDEYICDDCSKSCESCGDNICKKHDGTCNGCGNGLCESCEQSCKECGSTICQECHDNEKPCCEKEEEDKEEEEKPATPPRRTRRPRTT